MWVLVYSLLIYDCGFKNKFVKFLEYVLPHTQYPYEKTHYALEKRIRGLKNHEVYGQLWIDAK